MGVLGAVSQWAGSGPVGWGPGSLPQLECGDGGRGLGPVRGSPWVLGHREGLCCHFCHRDLLGEVVLRSRGAAGLEGKEAGQWSAFPAGSPQCCGRACPFSGMTPGGYSAGRDSGFPCPSGLGGRVWGFPGEQTVRGQARAAGAWAPTPSDPPAVWPRARGSAFLSFSGRVPQCPLGLTGED